MFSTKDAQVIDGYTRNRAFYWESALDTNFKFTHKYNTLGFRDSEWTIDKKDGTKRIMFVGDSFLEGVMAEQNETIPAQFANLTKGNIEVMNFGMLGTGIINYLQLIADITPVFKPDAVVLAIYANDFSASNPGFPTHTIEPELANPWLPRLAVLIKEWTRGYPIPPRWNGSKPILPKFGEKRFPWPSKQLMLNAAEPDIVEAICDGNMNPYRIDQLQREKRDLSNSPNLFPSLEFLKYWSEQHGFKPYVIYIPSRNQVSRKYLDHDLMACLSCDSNLDLTQPEYHSGRKILGQGCNELGLEFLDLTNAISLEEQNGRNLYWKYDEHMRATGYRLIAEQIQKRWPGLGE